MKKNLIFTAVILAAAALLYGVLRPRTSGGALVAALQYGEPQQTVEIPLDREKTYEYESCGYTIHLAVQDGGIAFVNSPCPDHLCEGFGILKNAGDWAACMPAHASLTIEEKNHEPDL